MAEFELDLLVVMLVVAAAVTFIAWRLLGHQAPPPERREVNVQLKGALGRAMDKRGHQQSPGCH